MMTIEFTKHVGKTKVKKEHSKIFNKHSEEDLTTKEKYVPISFDIKSLLDLFVIQSLYFLSCFINHRQKRKKFLKKLREAYNEQLDVLNIIDVSVN